MKFVIPSYQRANKITTVQFLLNEGVLQKNIYLVLHSQKEKEDYLKSNDFKGINILITNLHQGIVGQRNFIMETMPSPYIQLDDDISAYLKLIGDKFIKQKSGKFLEFLENAMALIVKNNISMFGISAYSNAGFCKGLPKYSFNKYFYGYCMGFNKLQTSIDKRIRVDEDMFIQLNAIKYSNGTIRFNHHTVNVKHQDSGGCFDIRKDLDESSLAVIDYYIINQIGHKIINDFGYQKLKKLAKNINIL